jgi:epoxyqueuosine reductase
MLGIIAVPLYRSQRGVEQYGLLGFALVVQTWVNLLEIGMSGTLGREMTRLKIGEASDSSVHSFLRSLDWLFLGIILTSLDIEPDSPAADTCGTCTRCLDVCPTGAFDGARRIDARKCISYLTIEHNGPIPDEYRRAIGNRIYGCDDCLAVCPWNRFADAAAANRAFLPRAELAAPRLADLLALDDAAFREMFAGSPIKRIGRDRMVRNCLIAAGNSRDAALLPSVERHLHDPDPVIAEAARWARDHLAASTAAMQAA